MSPGTIPLAVVLDTMEAGSTGKSQGQDRMKVADRGEPRVTESTAPRKQVRRTFTPLDRS